MSILPKKSCYSYQCTLYCVRNVFVERVFEWKKQKSVDLEKIY